MQNKQLETPSYTFGKYKFYPIVDHPGYWLCCDTFKGGSTELRLYYNTLSKVDVDDDREPLNAKRFSTCRNLSHYEIGVALLNWVESVLVKEQELLIKEQELLTKTKDRFYIEAYLADLDLKLFLKDTIAVFQGPEDTYIIIMPDLLLHNTDGQAQKWKPSSRSDWEGSLQLISEQAAFDQLAHLCFLGILEVG